MTLTVNFPGTLNWERELKKTKHQSCIDCLHCKVSVKSMVNRRLCFCAMSKTKKRHQEPYWLGKKTCEDFDDMGA
jgi:ribosomal protein L34E